MRWQYTWLPGESVKGIVEPLAPADALPEGQSLTAAEREAWRALWRDRLSRLHPNGGPCGHRPGCSK